ncbi:hypothetical protein ILUMI_11186 [Ignelater luminosus]|uniref:Uncharacterized protein n=1 Tax=Ignelater luminosus TaxID=2038154 RepID=A0A8K0D0P4_IGNLU|nr:hypothetical protein ILUMI_11186 [Ignelater luminosus]
MEKRVHISDWATERRTHNRNEEEICNFDFEGIPNAHPISDISSFVSHPFDSSKENVELSLEVEIADSLKHLIVSPERHDSALLDVTIVRPTDLDCVPGLENSNTLAFKSSEVRNLIASMERQKQQKKKLIEECKRKAASSKMNPINETHMVKSHTSSTQLIAKKEEHSSALHKRRLKRSENSRNPRTDIAVSSAPPKCSIRADYRLDNFRNIKNGKAAPIAILKPLVGEIKESLKSLEATIGQVGDQNIERKEHRKKKQDKLYLSTSESNISSDFIQDTKHLAEAHKGDHTHQVYAAPNTYDKLRTLLACQNPDRKDEENEKPCLCQHCGMVGLLVESQKRPIVPVPTGPPKKSDTFWPKPENVNEKGESECRKDHTRSRHAIDKPKNIEDLKTKVSDDASYWIIRELSTRLEALEVRVAAQEQRAVPKEYFKRIINKLWHRNNPDGSQFIMRANNMDRNVRLKDHSTQYSVESFENSLKSKRDIKPVKHRNVQIQQNTRKSCCVNPVFIVQDHEMPPLCNELQDNFSKNVSAKAVNAVSDFFVKKSDSGKKCDDPIIPKEKSSPMDTFWKWGEEIIKPGFDLKTKILSLLDEQFKSAKHASDTEQKSVALPKRSERKTNTQESTSKLKENNNKPSSPIVTEKKETFHDINQSKNEENFPRSSSRTLKKMLDMMSEKIYNEHVKPTVEAIKQEQKCFNNENTKQIDNIKAAMDAALSRINTKEVHVCHSTCKNVSILPHDNYEWQKDFLEPLEVPAALKRRVDDYNTKLNRLTKRSGIPVRVSNMSPTDSTLSDPFKPKENLKSLIPRLKSPSKDCPEYIKPCRDKSFLSETKPVKDQEKVRKKEKRERLFPKKQDTHIASGSSKSKRNQKLVQIKYMNPKAEYWNEESCASVIEDTSEENNQVMLTDNSSRSRDNNKEEIRRISQKYSVTDKLAFLINVTKEEMGKAHVWNNILKEAKNHCKSRQDTVIIQIPTKNHQPHLYRKHGLTEVEFTIEDIQKLVDSSKLKSSSDFTSKESVGSYNNMDSFLLIHSKKILQEVHKRLGKQMLKN